MIPRWNARTASDRLTLNDVVHVVATADSREITRRYCEERIKRGMRRGPWPLLPEEPTEPWERLPLPLLCRLLHEPLIVERLIMSPRIATLSRIDFRLVESPWRFYGAVVP